jgi:transcriptional regulator
LPGPVGARRPGARTPPAKNAPALGHATYDGPIYTPPFNAVGDEDEIRSLVAAARTAWLVTVDADGVPVATLLPILWHDDVVIAHMAKANPQWRGIADGAPALLIAGGPEAYISPSWYAAKAEHGKVVPTWNYTAVHLTGTVRVHQDAEWLRRAVTELTDGHEAGREHRWHVTDAPPTYIDGQLNGIVGIEFTVTRIEGKAKLSQNRSDADQAGVIAGLRADRLAPADAAAAAAVAAAMEGR